MAFYRSIAPKPFRQYFQHDVPRFQEPAKNEVDYVEPTDGSVDLSEVIGREVEVAILLKDLLGKSESNCDQFKALGIAGAAGSGKTTVCQMMFNNPQVQGRFLPRIWVCMTEHPWEDQDEKVTDDEDKRTHRGEDEEIIEKQRWEQVRKITVAERMLTCLGEDEEIIKEKRDKDGISGLVSLLHRQLVGKRYLIVLDDACKADEWYSLGSDYSIYKGKNFTCVNSTDWSQSLAFGLPRGYGGAVIVNGRSDKVVEMMVGKENLHHLFPLSGEDCWNIFKKATSGKPEDDPKVLKGFVMQGEGGHPLMPKLMGQSYKRVKDTAEHAADNRDVSTGEESAIQQANNSDGSSTAQVGPEASQVTAGQPVIAQIPEPEKSQVSVQQPVNGSNGSSIAQVTGSELAQVNAPPPADGSNGSSIDQVTGPEASQVTTLQPVNSSNGSFIAQETERESAQVTPPPPADSSNRSSIAQVTGQNQPRLPHRNWSIVAKVLRLKNLLGRTNRSYRTAGSR